MNRDDWTKPDFLTYEVLIMLEARIEKAREIAVNLLGAGLDAEFVSRMTGLSVEEVKELPKYDPSDRYL